MNILIIGGTRFQGLYLTDKLIQLGHNVTVFHRGIHKPNLPLKISEIIGDRDKENDLAQLSNLKFDACIDTCAYFPNQVTKLGKFLKISNYCLISSVAVYKSLYDISNEKSPLVDPCENSNPTREDQFLRNYGRLKVQCEREAINLFGDGTLIIRPSAIVGIGDHTKRLLFWLRLVGLHRVKLDFRDYQPQIQLVDVEDLADFTIKCIEKRRFGPVNVCGDPIYISELLGLIALISGKKTEQKSINFRDRLAVGLENLPFFENWQPNTYSNQLAKNWGLILSELSLKIYTIFTNAETEGFESIKFQDEERRILSLPSAH